MKYIIAATEQQAKAFQESYLLHPSKLILRAKQLLLLSKASIILLDDYECHPEWGEIQGILKTRAPAMRLKVWKLQAYKSDGELK
jgi:hypothetical protein